MTRHHITCRELATAAGYSFQYISHLRVVGRCEPTRRTMLEIAEAATYLIGEPVAVSDLFDLTVPIDSRRLERARNAADHGAHRTDDSRS